MQYTCTVGIFIYYILHSFYYGKVYTTHKTVEHTRIAIMFVLTHSHYTFAYERWLVELLYKPKSAYHLYLDYAHARVNREDRTVSFSATTIKYTRKIDTQRVSSSTSMYTYCDYKKSDRGKSRFMRKCAYFSLLVFVAAAVVIIAIAHISISLFQSHKWLVWCFLWFVIQMIDFQTKIAWKKLWKHCQRKK